MRIVALDQLWLYQQSLPLRQKLIFTSATEGVFLNKIIQINESEIKMWCSVLHTIISLLDTHKQTTDWLQLHIHTHRYIMIGLSLFCAQLKDAGLQQIWQTIVILSSFKLCGFESVDLKIRDYLFDNFLLQFAGLITLFKLQ